MLRDADLGGGPKASRIPAANWPSTARGNEPSWCSPIRSASMHIEKALDAYLLQLQADGRVASTCGQVRRHLLLLARWLGDGNGPTRVEKLGHEDLARFLSSPVVVCRDDGGPRSAPSTNQLRSSIRNFFA